MWNISVSQDTNNTAYTECFDLSITNKENNINLDNAYPISNDKGKSLTPYTFTVTNTCDIATEYSVNLEVLNNSTLASKFIDIMFEGNINLLSSYDSTDKVNISSIESRKLTTGILKSRKSKDYSLRLWLDCNTALEDLNNEVKSFKSKIVVVGKPINYTGDTVFNFDYTGTEQTFITPVSGTYRLETWGAQGGGAGTESSGVSGQGGYSTGNVYLSKNKTIYINDGGKTDSNYNSEGGYGGIGATHTSMNSDQLLTLENYKSDVLIISGGWGCSGYIGNSLLTNKVMYCYNCEESFEESTKTISTTCSEETPTSYCAKKGNGYARITIVSID